MTYTPQLRLTQDWQKVTYLHAQEEQGQFGIYYRVFVEHEGQTKHFNASPFLYDQTWCKGVSMAELKSGTEIEIRKFGGAYPETEWHIVE